MAKLRFAVYYNYYVLIIRFYIIIQKFANVKKILIYATLAVAKLEFSSRQSAVGSQRVGDTFALVPLRSNRKKCKKSTKI